MGQGSYVEDEFERDTDYIERRIVAGVSEVPDGSDPRADWPVEAGRYRLAVARACPWANRAIIVRRLLGLEDAISMAVAGPTHDADSWTFDLDPDGVDPVLGIPRLKDAYEAAFPGYPKGITVPAMVDVPYRAGRDQRLPGADPRPVDAVARSPPRRAPRTSTPRIGATRSTRSCSSSTRT